MATTAPIVSRLAGNKRLEPAVRRFAGRLEEQLGALDLVARNQEFAEIASLAHWLKGAAGTVGYDAFTEPAICLEQSAKASDAQACTNVLAQLHDMAARLEVPGDDTKQSTPPDSEAPTASKTMAFLSNRRVSSTRPIVSRLAGNRRLVPAVRRFAGRLEEQLDALDQAVRNREFVEIASLAHWLKGAAGTVGYDEFTEPATQLEQHAKAEAESRIGKLLSEIRSLSQRIVVPDDSEEVKVPA